MRIKVLSGGRKNIELSLSDAELNFQMRRIGIEETVPMCRLVEVSEKDNPLHRFEGQTVNMDEVNFFAKRMESLTEYERKVLSAYAEDYGVATMKDLINLTFSMKGLSLLTDFSDHGLGIPRKRHSKNAVLFSCRNLLATAGDFLHLEGRQHEKI